MMTTMDDDLWGPLPFVVQKDNTLRKQPLRGCEFWFDFRTDVLEEHFQNQRYCELVWKIVNKKDSVSIQDDVASSKSGGDSDKTLSAILPDDADISSEKSDLDEDGNISSISDASNDDTHGVEPDTRVKHVETVANEPLTLEVAEDADMSSSPVSTSKIEEAEEHSCSSLVTEHVYDLIKPAPESQSISQESIGGSTSKPLLLETSEKQIDSLQDIVTASELFTTESLLEMCDEPNKDRNERSLSEAEMIVNSVTESREKTESNISMNPRPVQPNKRQSSSNNSDNKNESFIRNIKQKVQGETGEVNIATDLVISTSELKKKSGKELKNIAKALKVTHYYKLKKEDLLQRLTSQLSPS